MPGIIELTNLRLHVFPETAIISPGSAQSVFVIVQDQTYAPVSGTEILVTVHYPSEKTLLLTGQTNEHGFIEVPLDTAYAPFETGKVIVEVEAISSSFPRNSSTSYQVAP